MNVEGWDFLLAEVPQEVVEEQVALELELVVLVVVVGFDVVELVEVG